MVNKTIAMTISEIVKSSDAFKKTHKIKVSGPYDDEDIPKWFKIYAEKTDERILTLEDKFEKFQNEPPKWFKIYAEKTDARILTLEDKFEKFQNEPPKWFKEYAEKSDARLAKLEDGLSKLTNLVITQFEKHGWIKK